MEHDFDGKQFSMQLSTRDPARVGEALLSLSHAARAIYTTNEGSKIEAQIVKELKTYGGLEKIFELIVTEKGIIQDYCITVLSGLTISNNEVGLAINSHRFVIQELLGKMKNYSRESGNLVLGLIQNMCFHYQVFRQRMAYEPGVLERIIKVLESEIPKPTFPFDANSYIFSGSASPRFSLFTILNNITMEKSIRGRLIDLGVIPLCIGMLKKAISPPSFPGETDNGEGAALEIMGQLAEIPTLRDQILQKYGSIKNLVPQSFADHPNRRTREWYSSICNMLSNPLHTCSNNSGSEACPKKETTEGSFRTCVCKRVWYCSDQCQRIHWAQHSQECLAIDKNIIEDLRRKKEQGNVMFLNGDLEGAVEAFTQALQICPKGKEDPVDYATLLVNRAASFNKLKQYEKAINDCTEALQMSPQYMKAYIWRAAAFQGLAQYRNALEDVCNGVSLMEPHAAKKDLRDIQLFSCEKLLGTKIRVVPVSKNKKQSGFNLLNIPQDMDSLDAVIRIFRKPETLLRKRLMEARRCWEIGVQLCEQGDFSTAIVKLGDALAIDERLLPIDLTIIHKCLQNVKQVGLESLLLNAFIAMQTGRTAEAESILTQSIDSVGKASNDREFLYLSRFYELRTAARCMLGNKKGGLEDLEFLASFNRNDCEYLYAKARIIQGKIDPNSPLLPHFAQVEALLLEFLSRADPEEKRVPFVLYHLSYLCCIKRDMAKAREYFRKAIEAEKIAAILWGSELDIENDLPRKLAFLILKSDLDARENKVKYVN